jgi:hypothetical protein
MNPLDLRGLLGVFGVAGVRVWQITSQCEGIRGSGARCRRALMWAIILHPDGIRKSFPGKKGTSCDAIKG